MHGEFARGGKNECLERQLFLLVTARWGCCLQQVLQNGNAEAERLSAPRGSRSDDVPSSQNGRGKGGGLDGSGVGVVEAVEARGERGVEGEAGGGDGPCCLEGEDL